MARRLNSRTLISILFAPSTFFSLRRVSRRLARGGGGEGMALMESITACSGRLPFSFLSLLPPLSPSATTEQLKNSAGACDDQRKVRRRRCGTPRRRTRAALSSGTAVVP
jgi:hypothetical protein